MGKRSRQLRRVKGSVQAGMMQQEKSRIALFVVALIIAACIPYVFSLGGSFTFDDEPLVVNNNIIHSFSNIGKAFNQGFYHETDGKCYYYRPLVTVSYMVNYALSGLSPAGYKFTNLLIHILVTLLGFAIFRRLIPGKGDIPALAAGLMFAVHPSHPEAVAWTAARTDLMATLFGLASLLAYLKYTDGRRGWYVCSLGLFALAVFSKEVALAVPIFIIAAALLFRREKPLLKLFIELAPFAVIAVVYLLARQHALGYALGSDPVQAKMGDKLMTVPSYVFFYLAKMFTLARSEPFFPEIGTPGPILSALGWVGMVILLALIPLLRRRAPWLSFALVVMIVPILLVSNIVTILGGRPFARFMYLPSAGLSMIFGMATAWFIEFRKDWATISKLIVAGILVFCAYQTYAGAAVWESNESVVERSIKTQPNNYAARIMAGRSYQDDGQDEQAIEQYKAAERLMPNRKEPYRKLIDIYTKQHRYAEAVPEAQKLVKIAPKYAEGWNQLALMLHGTGDDAGSAAALRHVVELAPRDAVYRSNLGNAYFSTQNFAQAAEQFRKALELRPNDKDDRYHFGIALINSGRIDEGRTELQKLIPGGGEYAGLAQKALSDVNGKL